MTRPRSSLDDSLTVFLITTGEDVEDECRAALERQSRAFQLEVISDVYPMSAAFQAMPDRCSTPYFLQVDADMVLEPHAVETLHDALRRSSSRVITVSGQLYEEGFGLGGSVKCWKRGLFRFFGFRDVRTVDRDLWRRTRRFGLGRKHLDTPLGTHVPRHSRESEWLKAKGDVEKWRFLGRPPELYAAPLVERLLERYPAEPDRLAGALLGALTVEPRLSRSKDIRYERAARAEALEVLGMPRGDEPPPDPDRRAAIVGAFVDAYAAGARKPLTDAVAALFPRAADRSAQEAVLALTAR
jgi:hypothetical protein